MVQLRRRSVKPLLKQVSGTATGVLQQKATEPSSPDDNLQRSPEDSPEQSEDNSNENIDTVNTLALHNENLRCEPGTSSTEPCNHAYGVGGSKRRRRAIAAMTNRRVLDQDAEAVDREDGSHVRSQESDSDDLEGFLRNRKSRKQYSSSQQIQSSASSQKAESDYQTKPLATMKSTSDIRRKQFVVPSLHSGPNSSAEKGHPGQISFPSQALSDGTLVRHLQDSDFDPSPRDSSSPALIVDYRAAVSDVKGTNKADLSAKDNLSSSPKCPLCNETIEPMLLDLFKSNIGARFQNKQRFCLLHREHDARKTWAQQGYPHIDWGSLDARLSRFHGDLSAILEQQKPSFYWVMLEEHVASGQHHKHLTDPEAFSRQSLEYGYYGERGARRMMEHVNAHFSTRIRRAAVHDRTIMAVGIPAFAQIVMVSELRLLLVMEDFDVEAERAKAILRNSKVLGDLLCADEEEHVRPLDHVLCTDSSR